MPRIADRLLERALTAVALAGLGPGLGVGLGVGFGPGHARAEDAAPLTPEQSASLDRAIRLWTNTPAGDRADAAADYTVTPQGDHYRISKPIASSFKIAGETIEGGALTASAKPLDGQRWALDDISTAMPLSITTSGVAASPAMSMTVDVKDQHGHGVIDPTLATPSSIETTAAGLSATLELEADQKLGMATGTISTRQDWQPAGDGRLDDTLHSDYADASMHFVAKDGAADIAVGHMSVDAAIKAISPERLAALIVLVRDKMSALTSTSAASQAGAKQAGTQQDAPPPSPPPAADNAPGAPTPNAPVTPPPAAAADAPNPAGKAKTGFALETPEQRRVAHALLDAVRDLASAVEVGSTVDDLAVSTGGHTVTLAKLVLQEGVAAPDGRADFHLRMAVEGIASADLPPAIARNYLPHRIVFAPRLSGLSVDQLYDFASKDIDGVEPKPGEFDAQFGDTLKTSPLVIGLDELSFDFGPAALHATGSFRLASMDPKEGTVDATVDVTGLGALIKRAGTDPLLKQAAPVLIFLKGIGEQVGDTTRWKVSYERGKTLVNGTDLSRLTK